MLGGFANRAGSAPPISRGPVLADNAFHDGLLPTYDFTNGGVLTPSYLIAPDITLQVITIPQPGAMMLIGFAGLGFARLSPGACDCNGAEFGGTASAAAAASRLWLDDDRTRRGRAWRRDTHRVRADRRRL